jgi:hypothetical protein
MKFVSPFPTVVPVGVAILFTNREVPMIARAITKAAAPYLIERLFVAISFNDKEELGAI